MANTRSKTQKTRAKKVVEIIGIRAEYAVVIAVVTFVVGFFIGRVSQNLELSSPNRELPVQTLMGNPTIDDQDWIAELKRQAAESPEAADGWTKLGNAYFDTGQFESAIEAYEKSLAIAPNNPNVITDLGIMYRRTGNSSRAIELFDRAANIDTSHVMSRFNKGVVLLHDLNDPDGALEAWKEVVELDPSFLSPTGQPVSEMVKALQSPSQ